MTDISLKDRSIFEKKQANNSNNERFENKLQINCLLKSNSLKLQRKQNLKKGIFKWNMNLQSLVVALLGVL
ncbi:hypothetical protein bpSLO_000764 [Borrelia parkeri]|uniref:hypothetical protein n=1 Tax=Borrelia parkeri TaxID=141 RepID=UPI001FF5BB6E|nr:hypothetical protein [Borrelia parkeri]UPA10886.1 hypothetical protein bpSLO_000764 [Borrelia parkeri]